MERLKNYKTLAYPEIDRERGFEEILNSPIYKNYVISEDGKTSGIVVYLKKDKKLFNIAGKLSLNEWQGQSNVEFIIDDISVNKTIKKTVPSSIG